MENKQQPQAQSGFLNGLLLGLVIGAGLVLLLTTKKGKRILRTISEDGLDSIGSLEDLYAKLEKALHADEAHEPVVQKEEAVKKIIAVTVAPEPVSQSVPSTETSERRLDNALQAPVAQPEPIIEKVLESAPIITRAPDAPMQQVSVSEPLPQPEVITIQKTTIEEPKEPVKEPTKLESENDDLDETNDDYVKAKPRVISVDHETSMKLADMQARLDREIHAVSEAIANNYVPYAEDDIEDEQPVQKVVKATRRRFFRGTSRRV